MAGMNHNWNPLMHSNLAQRAQQVVNQIAGALLEGANPSEPWSDVDTATVDSGALGHALLFAYLDHSYPSQGYQDYVERAVLESFEALGQQYRPFSLFGGLAGVAWASRVLGRLYGEPPIDLEGLEDLIWHQISQLQKSNVRFHFELIGGLAGLGQYALEAWPDPFGEKLLRWVSTRLIEDLRPIGNSRGWFTHPEWIPPIQQEYALDGYYNFGLAHGMPGALTVLAGAKGVGLDVPGLQDAIEDVTTYLEANAIVSVQPMRLAAMSTTPKGTNATRVAWCYGNPGCAAAFSWAGRLSSNKRLWEFGRRLGLDSLLVPDQETGVHDACLCHGSAGLGHLYGRLYAYHGDDRFLTGALHWYQRTLEMQSPQEGIAGYVHLLEPLRLADPSLLTGACGVALSLLAGLSDTIPAWDHLLACGSAPSDAQFS